MKSFKKHIDETEQIYPDSFLKNRTLMNMVKKHSDPLRFLLDVITTMSKGKLRVAKIGAASTREIAALWNDYNTTKISPNMVEGFLTDWAINIHRPAKMKSFKSYIVEELPTKEIKISEFPNPLSKRLKAIYQYKGDLDGEKGDDIVKTKSKSWSAKKLKPSQSAIYLGKSLGMAVGGVKGGNLGSIVSNDKHILDGHHRWAATLLSAPSAKITGIEANLGIGDLVPVLRAMGDSLGNKRRGEPEGGDINIFKAKVQDAIIALETGKNMDSKYYDKEKSIAWLESIGGKEELASRLNYIQSRRPPKGAPPRLEMPVIDSDKGQEITTASLLKKGKLDVREPYAK